MRSFTDREIRVVERMRRDGFTMRQIGAAIGRNSSSVGEICRRINVEPVFDDDAFDAKEGLLEYKGRAR